MRIQDYKKVNENDNRNVPVRGVSSSNVESEYSKDYRLAERTGKRMLNAFGYDEKTKELFIQSVKNGKFVKVLGKFFAEYKYASDIRKGVQGVRALFPSLYLDETFTRETMIYEFKLEDIGDIIANLMLKDDNQFIYGLYCILQLGSIPGIE